MMELKKGQPLKQHLASYQDPANLLREKKPVRDLWNLSPSLDVIGHTKTRISKHDVAPAIWLSCDITLNGPESDVIPFGN